MRTNIDFELAYEIFRERVICTWNNRFFPSRLLMTIWTSKHLANRSVVQLFFCAMWLAIGLRLTIDVGSELVRIIGEPAKVIYQKFQEAKQ